MQFVVSAYAGDFPISEAFESAHAALAKAQQWDEHGLTNLLISDDARDYTLVEFALRVVNK